MSDEEDDFKLRDKIAIEAMGALLSQPGIFLENDSDREKLALSAYKIADAMRKARLIAFK